MKKYKDLIVAIDNFLKTESWSKKSDTFYIKKSSNWGLIDFQTSKSNSDMRCNFTINIGVSSTALREFLEEDLSKKPLIENCHWRVRLGFVMMPRSDYWWEIDEQTYLDALILEVIDSIKHFAIPKINELISDEALETLWSNGISDGLTDLQRLVSLTTLLKIHHKKNLPMAIDELKKYSKNKPYEYIAKTHIKQLGYPYE